MEYSWTTFRMLYAGHIVFSRSKIAETHSDPSTLASDFKSTDQIYARAYWPRGIIYYYHYYSHYYSPSE